MHIMFWALIIAMILLAIALLVMPVLKVREATRLAYKDSNLKINDEKRKELKLDLVEGRIDQISYDVAGDELDRELLNDVASGDNEATAIREASVVRQHPVLAVIIAVFIPLLAVLLYLDLGVYQANDAGFMNAQQNTTEQPSVEQMTFQLQEKIEQDGGTVEEWIMLGRAHKHLGDNKQAANAFAVALETEVNNAQLMLERAEVLALSNDRQFTDEATRLVLNAYALEPENPNTLWFAGVAEYQSGNYQHAIDHLTRLLSLVREEEIIKSVIGIISKSRQALIASGKEMPELVALLGIEIVLSDVAADRGEVDSVTVASARSLSIAIDVSEKVKQTFAADDVVFVYAKAKQGPRMPLAVQRLTLSSLPATVILDDSMAMVTGMNISAFDELLVSARVTKTGSAIAQSGDYIGQIGVENKSTGAALTIIIDTLVP